MVVQVLKNKEIDRVRWDTLVAQSPNETPYGYSHYLDIVCPEWKGIVIDDYLLVCALPLKSKFGLKYFHQPSFLQRVAIFGKSNEMTQNAIRDEFLKINIGDVNLEQEILPNAKKLINLELNLEESVEKLRGHYSDNCRRNIKKAIKNGVVIERTSLLDLPFLIELFKSEKGSVINNLPSDFYDKLQLICEESGKLGNLEIYVSKLVNEVVGGMVVISSNKRKLLLFTASSLKAKNSGAMHRLISNYLELNANSNVIFDFEGSMNAGVARFYKGFGGVKKDYFHYNFKTSVMRKLKSQF